jgi:nickel-dependent lactate racemase
MSNRNVITATTVLLPYGERSLSVDLPTNNLLDVILPNAGAEETPNEADMIRAALENPVGSPRLRDLAHKGQHIAIVTSDLTRPCPSDRLLPYILQELADAGIPDEDIFIVIGLGLHRKMTEDEIDRLVSPQVHRRIRVLNHDVDDVVEQRYLAHTGGAHRPFVGADVRRCVGNLEFHWFAGFPVGQKQSCQVAPRAPR